MGPDTLAVQCVRSIVARIERPELWNDRVRSLADLPAELVQVLLSQVLAAGKLRSMGTLRLFLDCKHPAIVEWLQEQNLHGFEMRAGGVGLHQKNT